MAKFFDDVKKHDPELYGVVSSLADLAMAPGALDSKTKVLITLALDALAGAKKGVENLAKQARKLGATDQEIAEALRLAYFVAGNSVLVVSKEAFDDDDDDEDEEDDDDDHEDAEDEDEDNEDEDEENENDKINYQDDSEHNEGIRELKGSTLMVFDEEMIDGPPYLSAGDTAGCEVVQPGEAEGNEDTDQLPAGMDSKIADITKHEAASEDEYVILELPGTLI